MTPRVSVLVPTHDHGETLRYSVATALAQTVPDLEVFIVGDGVPDLTREVVAALVKQDERVRFFDNPKGPRHGEIHRHAALAHARGEIVCYLADDDLWLPHHVETMQRLLAGADFAHSLSMLVTTDGTLRTGNAIDLSIPGVRERVLAADVKVGGIPIATAAHTMALYRRLPEGWRTTPDDSAIDVYMWRQVLADSACRAVSGTLPTAIRFPSPERKAWSVEARVAELAAWHARITDPAWLRGFAREAFDALAHDYARQRLGYQLLRANKDRLREKLEQTRRERDRLQAKLQALRESDALRLGRRLLRVPLVGRAFRLLARQGSGRPAR